ncbi:Argonaute-binding protein 1 [Trichoderma lentiforme]|uniref:Argonaute-binding protein 1 n=1 Tax=Trichoderma lentiforme TaxID=1567552 RepID=A0A9P4X9Y5_9HYPO|nr:Argonaute-binding protein 1 [Trichoderma lentiforme]
MLPEMDSAAAPDGDGAKAIEPQPEVDESVISIPALSVTEAGPIAEEEEANEDALDDAIDAAQPSAPTKKKRKNKKSTAGRGPLALPKNRGNGFEEYFADPPMTPDEAMEEKQEIYSPRIQSCIQRFRSRRRIQFPRTTYFDDYLFLGGVDTNQGAYLGLDPKELKKLTPAQRREATARDVVYEGTGGGDRFYNGDETKWTVDFASVAAGFLSRAIIPLTGLQTEPMEDAIDVIENFLRYVLHHDVCPEYEENVKEALDICLMAREEWPMLNSLQTALPGLFNFAATELFSKTEPDAWALDLFQIPEGFDPKSVFYSAITMLGDIKVFEHLVGDAVELVNQYECTLEITKVNLPTTELIERFQKLAITTDGNKKIRLMPLGKVTLKPAVIEDGWVEPDIQHPLQGKEIDLYFEQNILANLKPGMKMTLEICELGADVRFVKRIRKIVPSFYTFLAQELMVHFRAPEKNDRAAPSVHNPTAEDSQPVEE